VLLEFIDQLRNVMVGFPCSLRVAVVSFVVIIIVFFAVAFIFFFLFFLVWLLSKEDIGSYRPIRRVQVEGFWMYAPHAQWYPCCPLANARAQCPGGRNPSSSRSGFHRRTIAMGSEISKMGRIVDFRRQE
jgi:hypothetical protein